MTSVYIIFIMSFSGTLLFALLCLMNKIFADYDVNWQYKLMKVIVCIYILPLPCFIIFLLAITISPDEVLMNGDDTSYIYFYSLFLPTWINEKWSLILHLVFSIWVIGFMLFFIFGIASDYIFLKKINKFSNIENRRMAVEIAEEVFREMGIDKKIDIYKCKLPVSPFIYGMVRPRIILPDIVYTKDELYIILKHEIMHYKENDIFFKVLTIIMKGIHWFNPFIWYFSKCFCNYSEMACDEKCLLLAGKKERKIYASLIVDMSEYQLGASNITAFISYDANYMERRVIHIMKKSKKVKRLIVYVISALFITICPFTAYATTEGVLQVIDASTNMMLKENGIAEKFMDKKIEETYDQFDINSFDTIVMPRGTNRFDVIIEPGKKISFDDLALNNGSSIRITASAENSTDSFKAGLINSDGKVRYVTSIDGSMNHTFQITDADTYKLYIENLNKVEKISIYGAYYVTY